MSRPAMRSRKPRTGSRPRSPRSPPRRRRRREVMRLQNKTALVTGAAQGFGLGIAETFAREGARVAVLDLNAAGAEQAARTIGNAATPLACDVANAADVERA